MPTNLLKTYNQLLELNCLTEHQRILSLKGVFNRDFVNNPDFSFRKKKLNPTPAEGEDTMERFFRHLTTVITDKATRQREYDPSRSVRLHWVRYHLEERKKDNMGGIICRRAGRKENLYLGQRRGLHYCS